MTERRAGKPYSGGDGKWVPGGPDADEIRMGCELNDLNGNVQRARMAQRAERLSALASPKSTKDTLSTYSDLAELIQLLPVLVREHRRRHRLSMRAAAKEIGCAPSTISRLDAGDDVSSPHIVAILRWLDGAGGEGERAVLADEQRQKCEGGSL